MSRSPRLHFAATLAALGLVLGVPATFGAPASPAWNGTLAGKLDPALASWATSGGEARTLWVSFAPRSAGDPARLATRLGEAAAAVSPRSLERRRRAGVWPLVDERDLPVDSEALASLRALGLEPFAVSRWLNRAAVRARPDRLAPLAALASVAAIAPVARETLRPRAPEPSPVIVTAPGDRSPGATSLGPVLPRTLGVPAGLADGQLRQIGVTALHDAGFNGAGVVIAILDEGYNFTWKHEALRDRVFPPGYLRDFIEGDTTVSDTTRLSTFAHGTWTLGCLAANLPGVYRGSGFGATVALARTEDHNSESPAEMLYWAQAAEWADSLGADLISSSVGYNLFPSPFPSYGPGDFDGRTTDITRAAEIAASKGILIVNAVGNGGSGPLPRLAAPADVVGDSLIAVGAVDSFGAVASFSSRGPTSDGRIKPDVVARGLGTWLVHSRGLPNAYETGDGTSFAAPLVAGLAASLMQARPDFSPLQITRAIRETSSSLGQPDNTQGWGIPNGGAARTWVPGPPGTSGPPAGYLELRATNASPFRLSDGPVRVSFGLGPRLGQSADARLRIFDAGGRLVHQLFYGSLTCCGWQSVEWNGRTLQGRAARPGIYFIHFDAEGRTRTQRVVLLQ